MMYLLYIITARTTLIDSARMIQPHIKELSRQDNFCNIRVNVFDPCEIEYLQQYCLRKHCINTIIRAGHRTNLLVNPETHTGYRYGASDVWKHIYAVSDDLLYKRLVTGLKFSIFVHICRYYVKMEGKYFSNTNLFFKNFRKADYDDFIWLLGLVYSAFAKINLNNLKLEDKERQLVSQIKKFTPDSNYEIGNTQYIDNIHVCLDIVNCVSCDKCKLWGKVQFNGLAIAMKIHNNIFDNDFDEFVFLVNLMTRLTVSANETLRFFQFKKQSSCHK